MLKGLFHGLAAGAAGTTALNAATYADMAARGRPSSSTPQQAVEKLAGQAGVDIPGQGQERQNRLEGLGPLSGAATGVGVGAVFGILRGLHIRLPFLADTAIIGASAMLAANLPMARMGITNPKTWSNQDWLSDVLPHLAYGAVTHATLRAMEK